MDKKLVGLLLVLGVSTLILFSMQPSSANTYTFEQYKAQFSKKYTDLQEEQYRKTIFLRNLVKIEAHNADARNTHTLGVNQFTDLSDAEFKEIYLTLQVPTDKTRVIAEEIDSKNLGADIDWVSAGKVTPVKNQAQCGSCWAFSATASLESAWLINDGTTWNLSEQELVDCSRSYGNQGCNGGWMDSAFQYVIDKKIGTTNEYPYTARDGSCQSSKTTTRVTQKGFVDVPGCDNLINALSARPVSVAVDASVWSSYRSGILSNCGTAVNHGVLLVGATDAYWRIKNSWAASWGESGYIRLARGNTCAVCSYPSYPTV